MGGKQKREVYGIHTMAASGITQRKCADTASVCKTGGECRASMRTDEEETYTKVNGLYVGMKGTFIFEQEQMGKQMREPPGYQLSSVMHRGNDATFCECCLSAGWLVGSPCSLRT